MRPLRAFIQSVTLAALVVSSAPPVQAAPSQGPTGNYYEYFSGPLTWGAARTAALGMSYLGQPGYLATVTSAEENAFLFSFSALGWLGGSDQAAEGTWIWADGPEANQVFWIGGPGGAAPPGAYANWGSGQPDNGGSQNFLLISSTGNSSGVWDDYYDYVAHGYFVEFTAPTPEPTTLLLWGTVMAGLVLARWRQHKHS